MCVPPAVHCLSPPLECQLQEGWDFLLLTAPSRKQCLAHSKSSVNPVEGEKKSKGEGGREGGEQRRKIKYVNLGAYGKGAPHTAVFLSASQLILTCGLETKDLCSKQALGSWLPLREGIHMILCRLSPEIPR